MKKRAVRNVVRILVLLALVGVEWVAGLEVGGRIDFCRGPTDVKQENILNLSESPLYKSTSQS